MYVCTCTCRCEWNGIYFNTPPVTPRVVVIFYESAMKAKKKRKAKAIRTADFKGMMFSRGNFCEAFRQPQLTLI